MRDDLRKLLVEPGTSDPLELEEQQRDDQEVVSGKLRAKSGSSYSIEEAIPRFVATEDVGQAQTADTFGYKWTNEGSFGSEGMKSEIHSWVLQRYGFESATEMRSYFGSKRLTLDAGCGAGFATSAWMNDDWQSNGSQWVGADISRAVDVARKRLGGVPWNALRTS